LAATTRTPPTRVCAWSSTRPHPSFYLNGARPWDATLHFFEKAAPSRLYLTHFLVRIKRDRFRPECEWRALILRNSDGFDTCDDGGRCYVEVPLQEHLHGVILGSKSLLCEKRNCEDRRPGCSSVPLPPRMISSPAHRSRAVWADGLNTLHLGYRSGRQ
jgi:hypothetical protein